LLGLGASFLFYKTLEYGFDVAEAKTQINILHYFLVGLQSVIILVLANSFSWK
jgi:putative membrane protein